MTEFIFVNNVNTTLSASATTSTTSLTLASSTGLPTLSAGQKMPLTLNDAATGQVYEIVYVTGISGATLTVERAQEGTAAQAWAIGDHAFSAPTSGSVASVNGSPSQIFQALAAAATGDVITLGQFLISTGSTYGELQIPCWDSSAGIMRTGLLQWLNTSLTSTTYAANTVFKTNITWPTSYSTLLFATGQHTNGQTAAGFSNYTFEAASTTGAQHVLSWGVSVTLPNTFTALAFGY